MVEQLSHVTWDSVPLIVDDKLLYITDNGTGASTCSIIRASLPQLLQSNNNSNSNGQVWYKLPDLPYSSFISHYQGHLITFGGCHCVEQPNTGNPVGQIVPKIHIYNHYTNIWDYVGEILYEYLIGRSVHTYKR